MADYELKRQGAHRYPPKATYHRPPDPERPRSSHSAYPDNSRLHKQRRRSQSQTRPSSIMSTSSTKQESPRITISFLKGKRSWWHKSSKSLDKESMEIIQSDISNSTSYSDRKQPPSTIKTLQYIPTPQETLKGGGDHSSLVSNRKSVNGTAHERRLSVDSKPISQAGPTRVNSAPQSVQNPQMEGTEPHRVHAQDSNGNSSLPPDTAYNKEYIKFLEKDFEKVLRETEEALIKERQGREQDKKNSDKTIDELRTRITDLASKATALPDQSSLRRPESEVTKEWQSLTYLVRNLVATYFKNVKESKMMKWAKTEPHLLKDITPSYMDAIKEKKCTAGLVEAAIWRVLWTWVFGNSAGTGTMFWAGKYRMNLTKLCSGIFQDIASMKSDKDTALFHQWKSLTTSILSLAAPLEDREEKIQEVADGLEVILDPLQTQTLTAKSLPGELRAIVRKAVALDQLFCGQQAWYNIVWPFNGICDIELDKDTMKVVGGGTKSHRVRFVVQPALGCVGGGHDNTFRTTFILDNFHVCLY